MRDRWMAVLIGLALCVSAGCSESNPVAHPSDQTVLLQGAVSKGDAAAIGALHLEDAQIIPPDTGEPVKGRAAVEALWQARMDDGLKAIVFSSGERRGDGDKQFETGTYTSRNVAGEIDVGKYFTVWQLVDQTWMVSRHTWASDLEEAGVAGEPEANSEADVAPERPQPDTATE